MSNARLRSSTQLMPTSSAMSSTSHPRVIATAGRSVSAGLLDRKGENEKMKISNMSKTSLRSETSSVVSERSLSDGSTKKKSGFFQALVSKLRGRSHSKPEVTIAARQSPIQETRKKIRPPTKREEPQFESPLYAIQNSSSGALPEVVFKSLPTALGFNETSINVTITDSSLDHYLNSTRSTLFAPFQGRRKLSTIPSVDESDDRSKASNRRSSSSSFGSLPDDESERDEARNVPQKKTVYVFKPDTEARLEETLKKIGNNDNNDKSSLGKKDSGGSEFSEHSSDTGDEKKRVDSTTASETKEIKEKEKRKMPKLDSLGGSASRLEVPSVEVKRKKSRDSDRRPSSASITSTSSGKSSSIDSSDSGEEIRITRSTSKDHIKVPIVIEEEDVPEGGISISISGGHSNNSLNLGPDSETPTPPISSNSSSLFHPSRRKSSSGKHSLRSKNSNEDPEPIKVQVVIVTETAMDKGNEKEEIIVPPPQSRSNSTSRHSTLDKPKKRRQSAIRKRSTSDPGPLGQAIRDKDDSSSVSTKKIGGLPSNLKRTLSHQGESFGSAENLYNENVENRIRQSSQETTKRLEKECQSWFESLGVQVPTNFDIALMEGVILFQLLVALSKKKLIASYHQKPSNPYQKLDNVSTFLQLLPIHLNLDIPSNYLFGTSDLFSHPQRLAKVYNSLLAVKSIWLRSQIVN